MKQDMRATRNFVSKALYYALRNSEKDFNDAMNSNDDSITDEIIEVVKITTATTLRNILMKSTMLYRRN